MQNIKKYLNFKLIINTKSIKYQTVGGLVINQEDATIN